MSDKVISLAKYGRSDMWSVRECLQSLIDDIDNGEINPDAIAVHWFTIDDDDTAETGYRIANLDYPNHTWLLHIALNALTERMRT